MGIAGNKNLISNKRTQFGISKKLWLVCLNLVFCGLSVVGCSSTSKPKASDRPLEPEMPKAYVDQKIATGPIVVKSKDDAGEVAWTLKAANSNIEILSDKSMVTELVNVYGGLYSEGKLSSNYKADLGVGEQKSGTLKLTKNVIMTSPDGSKELSANKIEWISGAEVFVATGQVKMVTLTGTFGPFGAIIATPDLKNIGTPDTMKQSTKWIAGPLAAALAASAIAGGVVFRDNQDNMSVINLTSWNAKLLGEDKLSFRGAGKPFVAKVKSQGLELRGRKIEGVANRSGALKFELDEVTVSGGSNAKIAAKTGQGVTTLYSDTINMKAVKLDMIFTLTGAVRVQNNSADAKSKLMLTSSKAVVTTAASPSGIKSMQLTGKVKVTSNSQDAKGKLNVFEGTANRVEYNEGTRTMKMIGNVVISGTNSGFGGTFTADAVEVLFDGKMQVVEMNATGDPGTASVQGTP